MAAAWQSAPIVEEPKRRPQQEGQPAWMSAPAVDEAPRAEQPPREAASNPVPEDSPSQERAPRGDGLLGAPGRFTEQVQSARQTMPEPYPGWDEVVNSEAFQQGDTRARHNLRQQFFRDTIAPSLEGEERREAEREFYRAPEADIRGTVEGSDWRPERQGERRGLETWESGATGRRPNESMDDARERAVEIGAAREGDDLPMSEELLRGLQNAGRGVMESFYGSRAMMTGDEDERQALLDKAAELRETSMENQGTVPSFTEIRSPGEAARWYTHALGAMAPSVGSIMAGGAAGGKAGAMVGALGGPKGSGIGAIVGSTMGSFSAGYALYAGGLYSDIRQQGGDHETSRNAALKWGAPASAVSIVLPMGFLASVTGYLGKDFVRNRARNMMVGAGLGLVGEGTAEGLAETFTIMGEEEVLGRTMSDEERRGRIVNAAAAGGVMGQAMGAVGGGVQQRGDIDTMIDGFIADMDTAYTEGASEDVRQAVIGTLESAESLTGNQQAMLEYLRTETTDRSRPLNQELKEVQQTALSVSQRDDAVNLERFTELTSKQADGTLTGTEGLELIAIQVNSPAVRDSLAQEAQAQVAGDPAAQQQATQDIADWEAQWREHEQQYGLAPIDLQQDTGISATVSPGVEAGQEAPGLQGVPAETAETAPVADDGDPLTTLIRTAPEQLDTTQQSTRDQLLAGDGYAMLREQAETRGPEVVALVDEMQVAANDGRLDDAARAYQQARDALAPEQAGLQMGETAVETQVVAPPSAEQAATPRLAPDQPSTEPGRLRPRVVPVDQIQVDPTAYQFRTEVNERGVDARLEGVQEWDDLRAGNIVLHERTDGRVFVADGHHRVDLARQLEQPDVNAIVLREADGVAVEDARRWAAEANIAAGSATAIDAAKVFRDSEGSAENVIAERNLPRSQLVRDGADIARLETEPFGAVLNKVITEKDGAAIGRAFTDAEQQLAAVDVFQRIQPQNDNQRALLVNEIRQAGFAESQGEQGGLFGDDPAQSLIGERVRVMDRLRQMLVRDRRLFATLNDNAQTAEAAGNRIATQANEALQDASFQAISLLERATTTPEINQQINDAARRVNEGQPVAEAARELKEVLLRGNDTAADQRGRSPAPGQRQADQAGQEPGRGEQVPGRDDARAARAGEQRLDARAGEAADAQGVTLKADGQPFQTQRAVQLSRRFRDTPGAVPVEVDGGWGFTVQEAAQPASPAEVAQGAFQSVVETVDTTSRRVDETTAGQQVDAPARSQDITERNPRLAEQIREEIEIFAGEDATDRQINIEARNAARGRPAEWMQDETADAIMADAGVVQSREAEASTSQEPASSPDATPLNLVSPQTGRPLEGVGYRVDGINLGRLYTGAQVPVMGPGTYVAASPADARDFAGDDSARVREVPIRLESPLVIRSDNQWRDLSNEAGWETPNPSLRDAAQTEQMVSDLQALARERGHDGIAVLWNDNTIYDMDETTGQPIKLLRNVFSKPQVVQFSDTLTLETQTEESLAAREQETQAAQQAEAEQRREQEQRAQADRDAGDFVLAGSDTAADQAMARGQDSLFRLEPPTRVAARRDAIAEAVSQHPELAGTNTIARVGELPIEAQIAMLRHGIDPSQVRGVFVGGDLYVVAENIANTAEGVKVAVHEAVGHRGVREVLGERLTPAMNQLYLSFPREHATWQQVRERYPHLDTSTREGRQEFAEELVAHLAESNPQVNAWQAFVARVRDLLRQVFPEVAWTEADVRALIQRSRETLAEQALADGTAVAGSPRFAVAPPTDSQAFRDWFGDSRVVDKKTGGPLEVYHGTPGDSFAIFGQSRGDGGGFAGGQPGMIYFAPSKRTAADHAYWENAEPKQPDDVSIVQRQGNSRVLPVYLSIENPVYQGTPQGKADLREAGRLADEAGTTVAEQLQAMGYDGVLPGRPGTDLKRQYEIMAFRPEQVKSAIGNVGTFDPANPDIRFSFAGQRAETADAHALERAEQALEQGLDAEAVRQATGWFRGADGKWRFEIDDSDARFLAHRDGIVGQLWTESLDRVLDHPKLFAAYPRLRDIDVESVRGMREGHHGRYDHRNNRITLNAGSSPMDQFSFLLHEVQHGIQHREGFATGGRPADYRLPPMREQWLRDKIQEMTRESSDFARDVLERYKSGEITSDQAQQRIQQRADESGLNELRRKLREGDARGAYRHYQRLYGETEARNVQTRQGMTEAERADTAPAETQDVPDSDVIVTYNGQEMASAPPPANAEAADSTRFSIGDTPGTTAWQRAEAKGLDMSQEGRMRRAREMGYIASIDQAVAAEMNDAEEITYRERAEGVGGAVQGDSEQIISGDGVRSDLRNAGGGDAAGSPGGVPQAFYHGTAEDIDAFQVGHWSQKDAGWLGQGIYVTDSPGLAESYANTKAGMADPNVMPLFIKPSSLLRVPFAVKRKMMGASPEDSRQLTERLRSLGFDGVITALPERDGIQEIALFNADDIRSTQAAFDPDGQGSSDLLFSLDAQRPTASQVRDSLQGIGGMGQPQVVDSADNVALNVALESTISGVNPQEAVAFYHGDQLYVVAGNAQDAAEAVRATVATVTGRNGLRQTIGSRADPILRDALAAAQRNIAGRETIRAVRAEFDHLSPDHQADQTALATEVVARLSERSDPPAFIAEASERLDTLLQELYPDAGFTTGDGAGLARTSQHHLAEQQRDFGQGRAPYSLPFVFTAQDGPGRGSLLDFAPQVVDADGNIISDARVDTAIQAGRNWGQGFFESATDRLRRSGSPMLVELARRTDAYFDQAEARLGMINGILREPLSRLRSLNPLQRRRNMRDFEAYMRHRDNGRQAQADEIAASNPAVGELAAAVDAMFDEVGTVNQTVKTPQGTGMRVFDSRTGAFRKIGKVRKGTFWPRAIRPEVQRVMHDPTSNTKLWHELLDALIDEGKAQTRKEAAEYLRGEGGYFRSEIANDYFAGIEKARGEKLPEAFYDYRFDVVTNYARKWSNRISQVEQFGQKVGPNSLDAFEQAATKARDARTQAYLQALSDRVYSRRPTDAYHEGMAMTNMAATGLQLGNPGTATLNLIGGTQLNVQMFGSRRMAQAYWELATEARQVFKDGSEMGILGKDVLNILRDADNRNSEYMDASSRTKELLSQFAAGTMKWGGYTGTEQIIRATGMIGARIQLMDALKAWNGRPHSKDARTYRAFMERNRIDVAKLIRENGKGEETARYLRLMVNIPQGSYRVDQTPLYVDTPIGRFMFKYQKFGTQVSRLFWQQKLKPFMDTVTDPSATAMDRAQAFLPIMQWFGWAVVGGGAVLAARSAMFGYLDPGPELEEIAKAFEDDEVASAWGMIASKMHANMIAGSAYGFFGNYIQMARDVADQQRVKNPFEPPGLAPLEAPIELLRRYLEQGRLHAADFEQVAQRQWSLYRTTKRGLAAAGRQAGLETDFVQLEQVRRDLQYVRKAARRFADDAGIDATRTATGRFGLSENTAANRKIVDALLIGNDAEARELIREELRSTPADERQRRLQSIRSTVRARQPVQLGGPASEEEVLAFRRWASDKLPPSRAALVEEVVTRYENAQIRSGLKDRR